MAKVNLIDVIKKLDALERAYSGLPLEVAATAVNFSKERFRQQGWLDNMPEPWKPRKNNRDRGRAILVGKGSGRLKRSIRKIYADQKKVIIGTDVPYARIHNEGGTIKKVLSARAHKHKASVRKRKGRPYRVDAYRVRSHKRRMNLTMPKRQFLGNSYTLERRLYLLMTARMIKALKTK